MPEILHYILLNTDIFQKFKDRTFMQEVWFPALICTGNQLVKVGGACFSWGLVTIDHIFNCLSAQV